MLELQVPLLAAKALLLLLLFAFIYAVVRRGIGDLRDVPDDDDSYGPSAAGDNGRRSGRGAYAGPSGRSSAYAELIVEDSAIMAPQTRFPVKGGTTSLGRSAGNDVILKSDDYASGKHAMLTRHGGLLYVEDAGSTNGTFVNGRKAVGATPLKPGDKVRVGSTTFRYEE